MCAHAVCALAYLTHEASVDATGSNSARAVGLVGCHPGR
jgi:hypothetical protein